MDRFVVKGNPDECWKWSGGDIRNGRPYYYRQTAARALCVKKYGPPPSNKHTASHTCGNKWCVNDDHIVWETMLENMSREDCRGSNKYPGVTKSNSWYRARIYTGGKRYDLGTFATPEEAKKARDEFIRSRNVVSQ